MSDPKNLTGLVIKAQSGFFMVETPEGLIQSKVRGKLHEERMNTDPVAIGDTVTISLVEVMEKDTVNVTGVIESVAPRQRAFTRQAHHRAGAPAETRSTASR